MEEAVLTTYPPEPDIQVHPAPTGAGKRLALLIVAAIGVVLCALRPAFAPIPAGLTLLFGVTLCVYATIVALAWFPLPWLSRRLEQTFEHVLDAERTGWYLMVALASFVRAEVATALKLRFDTVSFQDAARTIFREYVTGFSLDSLMNAIWASLWPMGLVQRHGVWPTALFALVVYGLYALGARTLGEARIGPAVRRSRSSASLVSQR